MTNELKAYLDAISDVNAIIDAYHYVQMVSPCPSEQEYYNTIKDQIRMLKEMQLGGETE